MTTENLLLKIEEKVVALLSEIENLHGQIRQLKLENLELKAIEGNHAAKLEGLIFLLDVFEVKESQVNAEVESSVVDDSVLMAL